MLTPRIARPSGRIFKTPAVDEDPTETALLDSAKLEIGRYQCPVCFLITRDRHDLKRHLRTHTKERPFQCTVCDRKFTRKYDLEQHLSRHTGIPNVKLKENPGQKSDETYSRLVLRLLEGIREGRTGIDLLDHTEETLEDTGVVKQEVIDDSYGDISAVNNIAESSFESPDETVKQDEVSTS